MLNSETCKNVLIIANLQKAEAGTIAQEIQSFLESRGISVRLFGFKGPSKIPHYECIDLAITLGGDGTVLFAARSLVDEQVPILPINLGNFGFITEVGKDDWHEDLDSFLQGRLTLGYRNMLALEVVRKKQVVFEAKALNDVVISGAGISKILNLGVALTQTQLGQYRADGIIVATPTGSTAYSAAAGGPILTPELDAMILNPICPFTLSHRPLVLPGNEVVTVLVEEGQRTDVILTLDGQLDCALQIGDRVRITRNEKRVKILFSGKRNFYEVLRSKLNWSGGPDA